MFLLCAMGPPGGGRQVISQHLLTRFNLINMTFPSVSKSFDVGNFIFSVLFSFMSEQLTCVLKFFSVFQLYIIKLYSFLMQLFYPFLSITMHSFSLDSLQFFFVSAHIYHFLYSFFLGFPCVYFTLFRRLK